jgi:hypothetical protein
MRGVLFGSHQWSYTDVVVGSAEYDQPRAASTVDFRMRVPRP